MRGQAGPGVSGFETMSNMLLSASLGGNLTLQAPAQPQWTSAMDQQQPWQPGNLAQLHAQVQAQATASGNTLSGGSGGTASLGGGRLDPATLAIKLAAAREKNRLAQQRFRERQRERQKQAGEQCEVVQQQIEELEDENEQLQRQNRIYEKVLAVRDAMLQTFSSLHATDTPPVSAAAQGLAQAIRELPSEGELEAASPLQVQVAAATAPVAGPTAASQEGPEAGKGQADTPNSTGSCAPADPPQPPNYSLGEQHRSGTAAQLDGSGLRKAVDSIPPATLEVQALVTAMTEPEHLLDYYRQWQAELSVSYLAAEACGFDEASVAEVEALQERMTLVWWHVGEMRPAYLCYLAHAALPENSGSWPLWREIAVEVFPQMDETQRALLRRSWHNYSKRLAKIAVGVSRWVRRLQEYALQPPDGLVVNAGRSLELLEITRHMADAVQEEYIATMEFVAGQAHTTSEMQKAFINHASAPFLPDVVAIDYHILLMDAEQRRARVNIPAPGMLPPADSAAAPASLPHASDVPAEAR